MEPSVPAFSLFFRSFLFFRKTECETHVVVFSVLKWLSLFTNCWTRSFSLCKLCLLCFFYLFSFCCHFFGECAVKLSKTLDVFFASSCCELEHIYCYIFTGSEIGEERGQEEGGWTRNPLLMHDCLLCVIFFVCEFYHHLIKIYNSWQNIYDKIYINNEEVQHHVWICI